MVHLLLVIIYISFISLGLPDGLLGSAWPTMRPELGVPVSYAGICLMPPLFGIIANHISVALMPIQLLIILGLMAMMYNKQFDFKDLMQFGMFILALLTFIFVNFK